MRKIAAITLLIWLSLAMACNFPVARRSPTKQTVAQSTGVLGSPVKPQGVNTLTPAPSTATGEAPFITPVTVSPGGSSTQEVASPDTLSNYITQSGDTLEAIAGRFEVPVDQVRSTQVLPGQGLLPIGQRLSIPDKVGTSPYPDRLLPDGEVVYSPSTVGFDIQGYIASAGGYLNLYRQDLDGEQLTGAEVVRLVAENTSINPRLLLAWIEFRSHWVTSKPANPDTLHPLAMSVPEYRGLYLELSLTAKLANMGYYGWRDGSLIRLAFPDGQNVHIAPQLNAGTVALQYLAARLFSRGEWETVLYGGGSLIKLYEKMFGDPMARAEQAGPIFPDGLRLPTLELPFAAGEEWSLTAGPHPDWNTGTPQGALDFAPITGERPCAVSTTWARAAAQGMVVRAANGVVLLDLDGDGNEQTGWVLLYMHIAQKDRAMVGAHLNPGDPIGHPSCEGGDATGTHVHLARKFNGEWVSAGGALPFVLSGWTAKPGRLPYEGSLVKDGQVVTAHPDGSFGSTINR